MLAAAPSQARSRRVGSVGGDDDANSPAASAASAARRPAPRSQEGSKQPAQPTGVHTSFIDDDDDDAGLTDGRQTASSSSSSRHVLASRHSPRPVQRTRHVTPPFTARPAPVDGRTTGKVNHQRPKHIRPPHLHTLILKRECVSWAQGDLLPRQHKFRDSHPRRTFQSPA